MSYGFGTVLSLPYDQAVPVVREALAGQGFGVLSEIDVTSTMKTKLDADMEDYVIVGACNPQLAHQALDQDRSIGLLLPCNVVVRSLDANSCQVEVLDPGLLSQLSDAPGLREIADVAAGKLRTALDHLESL